VGIFTLAPRNGKAPPAGTGGASDQQLQFLQAQGLQRQPASVVQLHLQSWTAGVLRSVIRSLLFHVAPSERIAI